MAEPSLFPHELLVRVEAFAPNPGDLASLPEVPAGSIPGWDGAGVVLEPAADGASPQQVGDRVLFLGLGARGWAQRRAVPHAVAAAAVPRRPCRVDETHLAMNINEGEAQPCSETDRIVTIAEAQ
ncbi:alcohol dehydrogenase catalytic domain-containing protein [Microbacterium saperdae]